MGTGLSRWENEGGAPQSEWMENRNRRSELAEAEDQILRRLGAGVIAQWNELPADIQRELFRHATSSDTLGDATGLKKQIALFLHAHAADKPASERSS